MYKQFRSNQRGFTLFEVLTVIAIISILASVVLLNVNEGRKKARDDRRLSDIQNILLAMALHGQEYGSYQVSGAGSGGNGQGSFQFDYTGFTSVGKQLVNLGYLSTAPHDPLAPEGLSISGGHYGYMIYGSRSVGIQGGVCIFARLESPSAEELATVVTPNPHPRAPTDSTIEYAKDGNRQMNYMECL